MKSSPPYPRPLSCSKSAAFKPPNLLDEAAAVDVTRVRWARTENDRASDEGLALQEGR